MTKNVSIQVSGSQTDESGQVLRTTQNVSGEYYEKGTAIYLRYEETDTENGFTTTNLLKIAGDTVSLTRSGHIRSTMIWTAGQTQLFDYSTPLGLLKFETRTEKLKTLSSEHRFTLKIAYKLYTDETFISDNRLIIDVQSKEE